MSNQIDKPETCSTLVGLSRLLDNGSISRAEYHHLYNLMAGIAAPTEFRVHKHFIVQRRLGRRYNILSRGEQIEVLEGFNRVSSRR